LPWRVEMPNKNSSTRVESWHISKLINAFNDTYEGKTKLEMPPFQRGIVWSPTEQSKLIRSLKLGYPIGSLLFYKRSADSKGIEINLLIDGLQRTTAIREYQKQPLSFMEIQDIDLPLSKLKNSILSTNIDDNIEQTFDQAIIQWMRQTKNLEAVAGFDAVGLANALNEKLEFPERFSLKDHKTLESIRIFIQEIKNECDISEIDIPILFFEGPEVFLPDIYEKINANGTKLSKYEIFAASWINQEVEIRNESVIEAIRLRYYALMTQKNISINGVKADGTPEKLSLFDYFFGLGKKLADEFPLLFGGNDDPTSMESVAFTLATVCFKLPLSQMKNLPEKLNRNENKKIKMDDFEAAVLESARFVTNTLTPFIGIKLNSESATSGTTHTDLQISSMVARAFCGKYVLGTWEQRDGADNDRQLLTKCLPQHYLADILQQNWRGSGDARLFQMVWEVIDPENIDQANLRPSPYYLRNISKTEFNTIFNQWFDDQIRLNQRARSYITGAARTFLKFIYSDVVTVNAEQKNFFELDHIFPVSRLAELARNDDGGWPISAISNLALFDWKTNREKSKLDLVQYLNRVEETDRSKKKESIEKYLFQSVDSSAIPIGSDGKDILTLEEFLVFLTNRFEIMKKLIISTIHSN
jgi:hypothetical protein